ncbi:hypothetical protein D3C81_2093700 [compost metagenome]
MRTRFLHISPVVIRFANRDNGTAIMFPVSSSPPARSTRIRPIGNTAAPIKEAMLPHSFGAPAITRISSKNPRAIKAPPKNPRIKTVSKGLCAFLMPISTVTFAI